MDTGYAGTIGAVNFDKMIGKSFFAKNGLLPRGYKAEGIHSWPTPDHTFLPGGTTPHITFDKATVRVGSATAGQTGLFGWNFGADYDKALIIVGNIQTIRFRSLLVIQDGAPTNNSAQSANGFSFWNEKFVDDTYLGKFTSAGGWLGGHTTLVTGNDAWRSAPRTGFNYQSLAMALHVDADAGVVKCFSRWGLSNWVETMSVASAHLATCRTASIVAQVEGALPAEMTFTLPLGVYAGN